MQSLFKWFRPSNNEEQLSPGGISDLVLNDIPPKAEANDFLGRFREIVSDPINAKISKHPWAGFYKGNDVILHNGIVVPFRGPHAYYDKFSEILIINRGVHEPLEEFCFQETLKVLNSSPVMIELGAYWGHYSMWCQSVLPNAELYLVEPDSNNLKSARYNFSRNSLKANFIQAFVSKGNFEIDQFTDVQNLKNISILHCDIQGFEVEMLNCAERSLSAQIIDYCFISTHSNSLHFECIRLLELYGYTIDVSAELDTTTTSFDGFILARSQKAKPVFNNFSFIGRKEILLNTF